MHLKRAVALLFKTGEIADGSGQQRLVSCGVRIVEYLDNPILVLGVDIIS